MNHRAAVPMLKTARAAWESESRAESYLAVLVGAAGAFLLARELWRLRAVWTGKN
ncbi:hypothetical protein [Halobellus litoreus]|jgi:hypothetical protein|uniref:Uncharacterized protein n=1 Tax=Halobellus litoreus TaxID=755310 RepID=A0ABD6E048_9EURY